MDEFSVLTGSFGKTGCILAREYLRVSIDRSGRERSQDDQHKDNQRATDRMGWTLGAPYRETGSASRYARKARKDFDRLMEDLASGQFGADVLIIWESSRGSRKVGEWVKLIELCEARNVKIFVTTHGRLYNPSNARDRRTMQEDAVDSEYEASKTSDRVRRTTETEAAIGKPHGPAAIGYMREYDPKTGRLVRQVEDPATSGMIRTLFAEIKAGNSLYGIQRLLAEQGWRKESGEPYSAQHLRVIALNVTYAGIRAHRPNLPEGERTTHSAALEPGDRMSKGQWEPLVSPEDFWAVQRILADPRRKTTRGGAARHLLSRIIRCECGEWMICSQREGYKHPIYRCRAGHVQVSKPDLDDIVESAVLAYLSSPEQYAATMNREQKAAGAEITKIRGDLEYVRAELANLRAKLADGKMSVDTVAAVEPKMIERIALMEARERELTIPSELHSLMGPGEDVSKRWAAMTISAKRQVMRIILTPNRLGEPTVMRRPKKGGGPKIPVEQLLRWTQD